MRVPQQLQSGEVGFNMTPMIDVVFLLIIFFLVSSHLAKQESQLDLPLPVADSGDTPVDSEQPRVTVNVLAEGAIRLAGRDTPINMLVARLQQHRQKEGPNLEVRIRSDRTVPYRNIEPIMKACADAGVWNVAFSVYNSRDVPR
ncbi:MAG: biopolymer transporter ExbD [Pirellulaceae bacterium]|jgi:biopolymer transport protein ExbD|nr:biopolymer transporter ExbD [Pirellulaceae bacterium]MDP7015108.1 biopolymer transporter ExbD [Pirellulaceae bacterium]